MFNINPLAETILGSIQQQNILGADKSRQLRRARALEKHVAEEDEQLESEVDGTEEVKAVNNDDGQRQQQSKQDLEDPNLEPPHIDIRG